MKKTYYIFFIIIIFLSSCNLKTNKISSDVSKIDLSEKVFDKYNVYSLAGRWNFYWDTLLEPSELKNVNINPKVVYTPASWAEYEIDNKNLPATGIATYNTQIILPEKGFYAMKFKRIFLSYKVWINDSIALEVGKVSSVKKGFIPNDLTKEHIFYTDTNIVDLTIQVSNHFYRKSGITNNVVIGTPESIEKLAYSNLLYEVFIIGALVFMMIFYFILYFYNKQVKSNLFFSLFLFFEILTLGFDGELFFVRIFPQINWIIASKAWNISSFLRPLFLLLFIEGLTKDYFSQIIKKVSVYFVAIMALFIAFTPVKIYTHTLLLFIIFALGSLIYEIFVTAKSIKQNKNIIFAILGLSFIFLSTINDTLYDYNIIKSFYSVGLGIFLFALLQAFLLSVKNAELFEKAENLTSSVEIQNRLKEALLSTPSYDIDSSLLAFVENVGVEKIMVFSIENEKIFISNYVKKDQTKQKVKIPVEFDQKNELFYTDFVKKAFLNHEITVFSTKKKKDTTNDYFAKNNIKNIIVLPLLEKENVIAVIYIENKISYLTNSQLAVIKSTSSQFYNIINTAVAYIRLKAVNEYLEKEVNIRTAEVEKQKHDIDHKNQELDEKIQLLEEQYIIQQEINSELETQNLELETQNEQISEQNEEIIQQKEQLEKHNKLISENIEYASTILKGLNQTEVEIPFSSSFYLSLPRDIVSGDFFWSKLIGNKFVFILGDSTGHGVPGALLSILGIRLLNKIIADLFEKDSDTLPSAILDNLRDTVKKQLSDENSEMKDGYDMSCCIYDTKSMELLYSGAYNPVFIIRDNNIIQLKPDRMPIGIYITGFEKPFSHQKIQILQKDRIYLFTDGFIDQFGEKTGEKIYMTNFKKILIEMQNQNLSDQKKLLENFFAGWKGKKPQIDDVSVVGFEV